MEEVLRKEAFYPNVTVELGIKEFKKLVRKGVEEGTIEKKHETRLIRDFKARQWEMYHQEFPLDNSSHPTHSKIGIDKMDLV